MSVGLTSRPDLFPEPVTSIPEFLDRVAREHPILGDLVRSGIVVDTNLYRNYMYRARQRYSSQGWFLIGDAADTVDPLYSTGLALVTMAIQQVGAMIRRDLAGGLTARYVSGLDRAYAGFLGLGEGQVARLYDVMQAGYQCRLRMHLHVVGFFHMALPLLLNGYHADAVGAAMMASLGRPAHGLGRQLTDFEPLIARAAARQPSRSVRAGVRVQSACATEPLVVRALPRRRDPALVVPDVPTPGRLAPGAHVDGGSAVVARPGSVARVAAVLPVGPGGRSARKTQSQAQQTDPVAVCVRPRRRHVRHSLLAIRRGRSSPDDARRPTRPWARIASLATAVPPHRVPSGRGDGVSSSARSTFRRPGETV